VLFAFALTVTGVLLGILTGAIQGFFGGKTDLHVSAFHRNLELMPELYLLIIFSALFAPSVGLLLILLSLFGWMGLSDYVRAEFLRNRQLDYVRAAGALGVSNRAIILAYPANSLTPVVILLPFRMSGAILALDLAGFSGPRRSATGTPSLGRVCRQRENDIDAWWVSHVHVLQCW